MNFNWDSPGRNFRVRVAVIYRYCHIGLIFQGGLVCMNLPCHRVFQAQTVCLLGNSAAGAQQKQGKE